jgi:hypothetical protein
MSTGSRRHVTCLMVARSSGSNCGIAVPAVPDAMT